MRRKYKYIVGIIILALPIASGCSASTYITDDYYSATGNRIAFAGGTMRSGFNVGLWASNTQNDSSSLYTNVGARLLRTS